MRLIWELNLPGNYTTISIEDKITTEQEMSVAMALVSGSTLNFLDSVDEDV